MAQTERKSDVFDTIVERWPSALVARSEVRAFSGGVLSGKTLANAESLGLPGPAPVRIGGKVAYRAEDLAAWLRSRAK